ncbi:Oidioi.mRNA.OKI2018_I69.PAR.g9200.t1.cds [Oikopleura dioica]|uniref:Oidioi.mRNA.OKI2018_I69.PAR.g9200.t1.cds n=1 Tax=Oikopleura dioica TaxID=34765 RepID=A0ABN7RM52_OIKDI|nr:Oidioi.mRNA.OKI2018_I69.PAR.g9200.t1.cds [Oikopleura dioica]
MKIFRACPILTAALAVRFEFGGQGYNQLDAKARCEERGGTLPYFNNEAEYEQYLEAYYEDSPKWNRRVWLGYERVPGTDTFVAPNGQTENLFFDWHSGEPNNANYNGGTHINPTFAPPKDPDAPWGTKKQRNKWPKGENCVEISSWGRNKRGMGTYKMNDNNCRRPRYFLCRFEDEV